LEKQQELQVYIDGKFYPKSEAKISVYDHGLLYGDGIFEGIRAYNRSVFKLREHIDRLFKSAHAIMLNIDVPKEDMIKAVTQTLKRNNLRDSYIRLVVTRGVGDLGLDPRKCIKPTIIIITDTIRLHNHDRKENGITAMISWVRRDAIDATSHEVKSLNYLNSILAKIEANNAGVEEAISLDRMGYVCEGVAENIFIVRNSTILTPHSSTGALPGITALVILGIARRLGYDARERNISPHELFTADEVFFTGTAAEIIPVREINKRTIGDGKRGPVTRRLMEEFLKVVQDPSQGVPIE
jgi:branched-chain amino acid aminotransferase